MRACVLPDRKQWDYETRQRRSWNKWYMCGCVCVCFQSEFTDKNLDVFHFSMGYFLVLCVHCFRAWDFFFVLNSFSFIPEKDRKMKYFTTAKKMKCTFSIWLHGICRAIFLTDQIKNEQKCYWFHFSFSLIRTHKRIRSFTPWHSQSILHLALYFAVYWLFCCIKIYVYLENKSKWLLFNVVSGSRFVFLPIIS